MHLTQQYACATCTLSAQNHTAAAMLPFDKVNPGIQCSRGKSVYLMSGGLELSSFHPSSHYKQLLWVGSTIHDATGKHSCATFIHIMYTCLNLHVMRSGVQHQPVIVQLVIDSFPLRVCAEGTLARLRHSIQCSSCMCIVTLSLPSHCATKVQKACCLYDKPKHHLFGTS